MSSSSGTATTTATLSPSILPLRVRRPESRRSPVESRWRGGLPTARRPNNDCRAGRPVTGSLFRATRRVYGPCGDRRAVPRRVRAPAGVLRAAAVRRAAGVDLVGETFARAYEERDRFSGDDPAPWLWGVARNVLHDAYRR